jgi:hypothetical protein
MENYKGLDQEIAEVRASAIRSGADMAVLEIPAALAERLRQRTEAEAKLADLGRARALLAGEAQAADAALAQAEARVASAAASVVVSWAELIADDFERARAEAQAHLDRLLGVAAVWTNDNGQGKLGPLSLSPRLRSIITAAQVPLKHDPKGHGLLRSLLTDPEAPHQVREAIARRDAGESTREIARSYAVDHATICRLRAAVSNVNCNGPTPLPCAQARSKSGDDHGPRAD